MGCNLEVRAPVIVQAQVGNQKTYPKKIRHTLGQGRVRHDGHLPEPGPAFVRDIDHYTAIRFFGLTFVFSRISRLLI